VRYRDQGQRGIGGYREIESRCGVGIAATARVSHTRVNPSKTSSPCARRVCAPRPQSTRRSSDGSRMQYRPLPGGARRAIRARALPSTSATVEARPIVRGPGIEGHRPLEVRRRRGARIRVRDVGWRSKTMAPIADERLVTRKAVANDGGQHAERNRDRQVVRQAVRERRNRPAATANERSSGSRTGRDDSARIEREVPRQCTILGKRVERSM